MLISDVSKLILALKDNSKRLIKIQLLTDFILSQKQDDSMLLFDILCGNFSREISKKELGISFKTIIQVLSSYYEMQPKEIESQFFKTGNIFSLIESIDKEQKGISSISSPLSLQDISNAFIKIKNTSGKNSNTFKKDIILSLYSKSKSLEERMVLSAFLSDLMKIGVNEGVLIDAFIFAYFPKIQGTHYYNIKKEKWFISQDIADEMSIKTTDFSTKSKYEEYNKLSYNNITTLLNFNFPLTKYYILELSESSKTSREIQIEFREYFEKLYNFNVSFKTSFDKLKESLNHLQHPPIIFKKPIQVMLGPRLYSFDEAKERFPFPIFSDYKYDGLRLIIQNNFGDVSLFSRNLENLTSQFPEIVQFVKDNFSDISCVLDSECLGYNNKTFEIVQFQELSKRIMTKSHNLKTNIFIGAKFFDILELNGELLYELPLEQRQLKLKEFFSNKKLIIQKKITNQHISEKLEEYFKEN